MKLIPLHPLSLGLHAKVDDEDYAELMKYEWYAKPTRRKGGGFKAMRGVGDSRIAMHQHITGFSRTIHADRDDLNNQRGNLRPMHRQTDRNAAGEKWCPHPECQLWKPPSEFNANMINADGLQSYCRPCQKVVARKHLERKPRPRTCEMSLEEREVIRERGRTYYKNNSQRVREAMLFAKYAITYEEKLAMFAAQEGQCVVCFNPLPPMGVKGKKEPGVDHSHVTGKVRSLLCTGCNTSEGQLKGDFRNSFAMGMYQMNDGPYYGPITVISDLGTWTSAIRRVDGATARVWERGP